MTGINVAPRKDCAIVNVGDLAQVHVPALKLNVKSPPSFCAVGWTLDGGVQDTYAFNLPSCAQTMNAGFLPIAKGIRMDGARKWVENASFGTIGSPTHTHKGA